MSTNRLSPSRLLVALTLAAAAGCEDNQEVPDMAVDAAVDRAAPPDLGADDMGEEDAAQPDLVPAPTVEKRYVVSRLRMPVGKDDYSVDLNGDSKADNRLGELFAALAGLNLSGQAAMDQAVTDGDVVHLFTLTTHDPQLQTDDIAAMTLLHGAPAGGGAPDLGGGGKFTIDNTYAAGTVDGTLSAAVFRGQSPATLAVPATVTLRLPFFGGTPIDLPLRGAYVRCSVAQSGLTTGQLDGSIKDSDIASILVPGMAESLTAVVDDDPMSDAAKIITQAFDNGNGAGGTCTNPDGSTGTPDDEAIDECEITSHPTFGPLLQPDVDIYSATGKYMPNPANTSPDSLSVGIGFTAAGASY